MSAKYATPESDLAALRRIVQQRLTEGDVGEQRLLEYRKVAAEWVGKLQAELTALEEIDPELLPLCGKILADFPACASDPRPVRNIVAQLRNLAGGAQRTLKENPALIRALLKKIEGRTAGDFADCTVATRVDIDRNELRPLLDHARGLEPVREEIEKLKVALAAASQRALAREREGAPPPLRLDRLDVKILENAKAETVEAVPSVRPRRDHGRTKEQ